MKTMLVWKTETFADRYVSAKQLRLKYPQHVPVLIHVPRLYDHDSKDSRQVLVKLMIDRVLTVSQLEKKLQRLHYNDHDNNNDDDEFFITFASRIFDGHETIFKIYHTWMSDDLTLHGQVVSKKTSITLI